MKDRILRAIYQLFFLACLLATLGGIALFVCVLLGLIISGDSGSSIVLFGQQVLVPAFEWIMGGAVLIGIVSMYMSKTYAYRMEKTPSKK